MNSRSITCAAAILMALAGSAAAASKAADAAPRIEVCFVLDTTGSMGGLIEGAKVKIWAIANQMVSARPTPQLKIALIGYRDRGDEYVTRLYDLSGDIDTVYADLQKFQAGGGGDTPESVNQALAEAVSRISWSQDRAVLKLVFLVGDSPPHMDYAGDVRYQATCELAAKKDLIINTVQCGTNSETAAIWQDIAGRAEGRFVAVGQSGDMQVVSTPMDKELTALNVAVGRTLTPYGAVTAQRAVLAKQAASESVAAPAAADRLAYNVATGKAVQGGGDLVDDLKVGNVTLADIKKEDLPAAMQGMTPDQMQAFLKTRSEERQKIQSRISELVKLRQQYIQEEMGRRAKAGGFDEQIRAIITEQAGAKGIRYGADGKK